MIEMMKHSDAILKKILGKEKFRELLEFVPDVLDERLGEDHSPIEGILITKLLNKFILHLGIMIAGGKTIEDYEKILNPEYKKVIPFESAEDIYNVFKEYVDLVANYNK